MITDWSKVSISLIYPRNRSLSNYSNMWVWELETLIRFPTVLQKVLTRAKFWTTGDVKSRLGTAEKLCWWFQSFRQITSIFNELFTASGFVTLNTPVLVGSLKLSNVERG
uniref:Uncharacterized protein n=1 Tax=Cacopsylla melanoneura TaxID=428564 RepID=A0A8D8SNB3_9HEMI